MKEGHHSTSVGTVRLARMHVFACAVACALGSALLPGSTLGAQAPARHPLVFNGATVIDVKTGARLADQRVVVVENRIRAVGKSSAVSIPAGATVIDAQGKYLIPGLFDMHTHCRRLPGCYSLLLANGITGFRDAGSEVPIDTLHLWRKEVLDGKRVGPPREFFSSRLMDTSSACDRANTLPVGHYHTCVKDSADARFLVDSFYKAGVDFIKTYNLSGPMYFVIAAEARRVGIPFGGHIQENTPGAATAQQASDSGALFIEHHLASGGLDTLCLYEHETLARCQALAEHFRKNGSWWVPTLTIIDTWYPQYGYKTITGETTRALLSGFQAFSQDFADGKPVKLGWLDDYAPSLSQGALGPGTNPDSMSGILHLPRISRLPILAGTDAGGVDGNVWAIPGFSLHTELVVYVLEGLTPLQALQTATVNPARALSRALHRPDSLGVVAAGKLADMVLLDEDPLLDIRNITKIRAVVADGRYYDRNALDDLITKGQHSSSFSSHM